MLIFHLFGGCIQKTDRRAINDRNAAFGIEADHSGADASENGLSKPPSRIDLPAGFHKIRPLRLELCRHPVKRSAKYANFVVVALHRYTRRKIATRDLLRGANQF
jgi:hypothetical protein